MLRITRGLNYLLRKGITSHNLKSGNIFFTNDEIEFVPKLGLPEYKDK